MQNINSDQLRRQLDENNAAMNTLADNNQKIVELLAQRGLKAIEKTAGEDLVCCADRMIIHNAGGAEVFNTDWPNPLVNPDQYEARRRMAEWVSEFTKVREDRMPLTTEELKNGGWWCDDVSEECRLAFVDNGLDTRSADWSWSGEDEYKYCYLSGIVITRTRTQVHEKKQIHRIGNHFYWGAPSDQAN